MWLSPIFYAIAAAVGWGITDYAAALASRKIGVFQTALLTQAVGGFFVFALSVNALPLVLQFPHVALMAVGLGVLNTLAVLSTYKSFEVGELSIASPLTSSFPALSTVLAIILLGEVVTPLRALGILATLGGIVFVTTQSSGDRVTDPVKRQNSLRRKGTEYALIAFAALGVLYFALKVVVASLGPFVPVLLLRLGMGSTLGFILVTTKSKLKAPSKMSSVLKLILVVAILDILAGVAYNLGVQRGDVSVVSTISGLYSIVTILLAGIFLNERLKRFQWAGVLAIVVGVALLGIAG